MIEFDCETTGLQFPYHDAFSFQASDGQNHEVIWVGEPGWHERAQAWLDRAAHEGLRAWNTKFDLHFSEKAGLKLPPESQWHDGMLISFTLDERHSNSLEAASGRLGFEDKADNKAAVKQWLTDERKRRKHEAEENGTELIEPNYSDVPREIMKPYALNDVIATRQVCDVLEPRLEQTAELKAVVEFEREVMGALYAVENRGFPVDEEGYRRLELELIENLEALDDQIATLALQGVPPEDQEDFEFNPNSSQQLLVALKRRGADLAFVTNDSMDAENLETVHDELADAILDFRSEYKALSTYVRPYLGRSWNKSLRVWQEPFIAPDGRIHANYRQVGARTARMSCSDPNLQNQPRDDLRLRYNFRAEPGHKLVACDLSGIEMAVFAAYAGEGRLLNAIREGADLHTMTADYIGLRERQRPGGVVESKRQRGKVFNFSIVYGAGVRSVRKAFRVSQSDARAMINRYHDAYPEVGRLQARVAYRLEDTGYIKSAWGRRFRVSPREAYKGVNYLVQGTSAEILKASLVRLHKEGVPVVGLVHDEVVAHVPEADAAEAKHAIIEALIDHPRITEKVPLRADGDIVDRWSEVKDPDFKPKWAA